MFHFYKDTFGMKVDKINLVGLNGAPSLDCLFVAQLQLKAMERNLVSELPQIAHRTRLCSTEPSQFSRDLCVQVCEVLL